MKSILFAIGMLVFPGASEAACYFDCPPIIEPRRDMPFYRYQLESEAAGRLYGLRDGRSDLTRELEAPGGPLEPTWRERREYRHPYYDRDED